MEKSSQEEILEKLNNSSKLNESKILLQKFGQDNQQIINLLYENYTKVIGDQTIKTTRLIKSKEKNPISEKIDKSSSSQVHKYSKKIKENINTKRRKTLSISLSSSKKHNIEPLNKELSIIHHKKSILQSSKNIFLKSKKTAIGTSNSCINNNSNKKDINQRHLLPKNKTKNVNLNLNTKFANAKPLSKGVLNNNITQSKINNNIIKNTPIEIKNLKLKNEPNNSSSNINVNINISKDTLNQTLPIRVNNINHNTINAYHTNRPSVPDPNHLLNNSFNFNETKKSTNLIKLRRLSNFKDGVYSKSNKLKDKYDIKGKILTTRNSKNRFSSNYIYNNYNSELTLNKYNNSTINDFSSDFLNNSVSSNRKIALSNKRFNILTNKSKVNDDYYSQSQKNYYSNYSSYLDYVNKSHNNCQKVKGQINKKPMSQEKKYNFRINVNTINGKNKGQNSLNGENSIGGNIGNMSNDVNNRKNSKIGHEEDIKDKKVIVDLNNILNYKPKRVISYDITSQINGINDKPQQVIFNTTNNINFIFNQIDNGHGSTNSNSNNINNHINNNEAPISKNVQINNNNNTNTSNATSTNLNKIPSKNSVSNGNESVCSIPNSSNICDITSSTDMKIKYLNKIYTISKPGVEKIGTDTQKINQDNFFNYSFTIEPKNKSSPSVSFKFIGVCDGHGENGHLVSAFISEKLPKILEQELIEKTDLYFNSNSNTNNILNNSITPLITQNYLAKIVKKSLNDSFMSVSSKLSNCTNIETNFSGSTCVSVLYLNTNKIYIANVGDSRAIIIKNQKSSNNKDKITNNDSKNDKKDSKIDLNNPNSTKKWTYAELSRDHKANEEDEKNRIIRLGGRVCQYKNEKGEYLGPPRIWLQNQNIPGLAMTRSFGDQFASIVGVICDPEIKEYCIKEEDKYLVIASDGLYEYLGNQEVAEIVGAEVDGSEGDGINEEELAKALYRSARNRWIKNDNCIDDITIVVVKIE